MEALYDKNVLKELSFFLSNYDIITDYHFDRINKKTYIGQKIKQCRFCGESDAKFFKKKAHAFPQFIGNRYLLTHYECDLCNEQFSRILEHEMANFIKPFHTAFGVKGENNIPIYKNKGIRFESSGTQLEISGINDTLLIGNLNDRNFSLNLITEKFVPIAVYKCLVKMALSIMPETEMIFLTKTLDWIREQSHNNNQFKFDNLWLILSIISNQHAFKNISAVILKRKNKALVTLPSFIFRLTYAKFSFQIYIPLCSLDTKINFIKQDLQYLPHLIDVKTGLASSENYYVDFSSNEISEMQINLGITNLNK